MERETVFKLENVSYVYPHGKKALKDVTMEIYKGERVAILGPNGGGKTTLLKILDGLFMPTHGSIKAMGIDLESMNDKERYHLRRKIGFVFQDPDIELFSPTVYDDIAYGPLHLGISESEIKKRVEKILKLLKIEKIKEEHPYNLSAGEKKKAALAAVLSIDPDVLLLDEPTADLDPRSRVELIELLKDLNRRGKTIIIATHDVNAVPEIAERVFILNKKVIAEGEIQKIFSDTKLLQENNIDLPDVLRLFEVLRCFSYPCDKLPLTIDDAVRDLLEKIKRNGITLNLNEKTYTDIKKIL